MAQRPSTLRIFAHRLSDCEPRADNIEGAWAQVQPVLDFWGNNPAKNFPNYLAGSYGPQSADEMLQRDGRSWRPIT
jgi:glucose-6-phosphate 1-dehydrogenase